MIADFRIRVPRAATAPDEFAEHLLEHYQRTGAGYDAWAGGLHDRAAARLVELLDPQPGEQALDVGCGTGLVARRLAGGVGGGGRVVGVDISEHMLELARAGSGGAATFLHMAAEDLAFPDGAFDLVVLGQTLPYLRDPDAALAQAWRVLKPGGRLGVSCQRRRLATPAQNAFFACLGGLARRHPLRVPRPAEDRAVFGEPRVLGTILRQAGFSPIDRAQTIVGGLAADAAAWAELMSGAGPFPHALISVLGPGARARFEMEVDLVMSQLEDEAFRLHHAFTFAVTHRPGGPRRLPG